MSLATFTRYDLNVVGVDAAGAAASLSVMDPVEIQFLLMVSDGDAAEKRRTATIVYKPTTTLSNGRLRQVTADQTTCRISFLLLELHN